MNNNASVFSEKMSKDFIDRNHLLKMIELTVEKAREAKLSDQYIHGLKACIRLIRLERTEY